MSFPYLGDGTPETSGDPGDTHHIRKYRPGKGALPEKMAGLGKAVL